MFGPIIGVLGKTVDGLGQIVHAIPGAGPVADAATRAAADAGVGVVAGVGQMTGGVLAGTGEAVGGLAGGLDSTLGGLASAVKDLASPTPSVIGSPPAEQGKNTSEFKMTAVKSFLLALFALAASFGVIVPPAAQGIVLAVCPIAIGILGAAYSISRGLRKRGTA